MKTRCERKLAEEVRLLLTKKGIKAYEKAKRILLNEKIHCPIVKGAMHYFMEEWSEIYHPGLLTIACESVGGNPNSTVGIGASLLLILSGVHIHDDIIDESQVKNGKLTLYGRFGKEIALLVGDAFLLEGLMLLHKSCEKLSKDKKKEIIMFVKKGLVEIGCGEATETILRKKRVLLPKECLSYLNMRAAMAETIMRIGAIVGGGSKKEIETLCHYGRTLGLLAAIREEFIDIFEPDELKNRYKNEILPLPVLCSFQDKAIKKMILGILRKKKITEEDTYTIAELVLNSKETQKLKSYMQGLIKKEKESLRKLGRSLERLELLLESTIEDL